MGVILALLMGLGSCKPEDKDCEPGRPFQNILGAWDTSFKKDGVARKGVLIMRVNGKMLDPYHTLHLPPKSKPGFAPILPELLYKVEDNRIRYYVIYKDATYLNEWNEGEIKLNECNKMTISLPDVELVLTRKKRK